MNSFEELRTLLPVLKKKEFITAKKHVDSAGHQKSREGAAILLEQLRKNPGWEKAGLHQARFPQMKEKSFDQLCRRTMDNLLESLMLDRNTQDRTVMSEFGEARASTLKMLGIVRIMLARGTKSLAYNYLKKTIDKAERYELFEELIQLYMIDSDENDFRDHTKVYKAYKKKLDQIHYCSSSFADARLRYHQHILDHEHFTGKRIPDLNFLEESLEKTKTYYSETRSARIGFYYYSLLMEYHLLRGEGQACYDAGMALKKLIQESPPLNFLFSLGFCLGNHCVNCMYFLWLEDALYFARWARDCFPEGSYNHNQHLEMVARCRYYLGDLEQARADLEKVLSRTRDGGQDIPFLLNRRRCLYACVLFNQGEPREALNILNQLEVIHYDKQGWNIGIRCLSILCLVELGLYLIVDAHVESMRKHLERIPVEDQERMQRESLILRLLQKMVKRNFDFQAVAREHQKDLEALSDLNGPFGWEVKSPELVVFQDWLRDKMAGRPYRFRIPEKIPAESWSTEKANSQQEE